MMAIASVDFTKIARYSASACSAAVPAARRRSRRLLSATGGAVGRERIDAVPLPRADFHATVAWAVGIDAGGLAAWMEPVDTPQGLCHAAERLGDHRAAADLILLGWLSAEEILDEIVPPSAHGIVAIHAVAVEIGRAHV